MVHGHLLAYQKYKKYGGERAQNKTFNIFSSFNFDKPMGKTIQKYILKLFQICILKLFQISYIETFSNFIVKLFLNIYFEAFSYFHFM